MVAAEIGNVAQTLAQEGDVSYAKSLCVGIVVLNWNSATNTLRCLDSVFASDYNPVQVVVVDNASEDGSVDVIREHYPQLNILINERNLGYTGGNNVGIRYILTQGADCVLLLNDDVVIDWRMISSLVAAIKAHPDAGCLGPKVYAIEEPMKLLSAGGLLDSKWNVTYRGVGQHDEGKYDTLAEVDCLSGCALFFTREMIENVGMLDTEFFAYHEDVDLCFRGRQAGFKVLFVPEAKVWHPDTGERDKNSARISYYISRNHLLFLKKHNAPWIIHIQAWAGLIRNLLGWTLRPKWRYKREQRNALWWALVDSMLGVTGMEERVY